ncbi:pre-toxin TG domain-containing protein [Paenibacillus sp. L3-i20]|uniref:pre-toxin TG domain-containing protein n=1 Tax=Paenibacillus sp. L3-i20 TaxID=2905833 RepID=UPI001EDCC15C|nr:pre-toxin TG domain-containing protein [Paenibacillus sp. L3-i20]GKU77606.1 hypothetical protein L3i20_v220030 [Paenibacillus sp. L3-i20]
MSPIHIDIGRMQQLKVSLGQHVQRSSTLIRGVGFIRVDSAITARRQIGTRLYRTNSRLLELERRIKALQTFTNHATEQYDLTEKAINRAVPNRTIQAVTVNRYGGQGKQPTKLTPEQAAALAMLGRTMFDMMKGWADRQAKWKEQQASAPPVTYVQPNVTVKEYKFDDDENDYVVYTSDGKKTVIGFKNLEDLLYTYNAGKMVEMWPADVFEQVRGVDKEKIEEFLKYAISEGYDPVTFQYKGKGIQTDSGAQSYVEKRGHYYEENKEGPTWFQDGVSFGLDVIPFVGNFKALLEGISGKNVITGDELSTGDRWLAAGGVFIPWIRKAGTVADIVKQGDKVVDNIPPSGPGRNKPIDEFDDTDIYDGARDSRIDGTGKGNLFDKDGKYNGGRNQEELDDLARDPASGGKIEPKNIREREVGLAVEARGDLGKLIRDPQAEKGAEFIDTTSGLKWDVKSFESYPSGDNGVPITNPKKGAFTIQQGMKKLQKEFDNGNNVIIDTRKMEPVHLDQLKKAIDEAGVADKIIWYP